MLFWIIKEVELGQRLRKQECRNEKKYLTNIQYDDLECRVDQDSEQVWVWKEVFDESLAATGHATPVGGFLQTQTPFFLVFFLSNSSFLRSD